MPQDGYEKQDCERAAMHRLLRRFRKKHKILRATLLVDALHANQPSFSFLIELGLNWIAACKPGSHKTLYEWVGTARTGGDLKGHHERVRIGGDFFKRQYEYMNDVPIRDSSDAIKVKFVSLIEINEKRMSVINLIMLAI